MKGITIWALFAVSGVALAQDGNPFDPKDYLGEQTIKQEMVNRDVLISRSIYRIDGLRFQRFDTTDGAVYLKSPDSIPELLGTFALCPTHIRLMTEVLPLRKGLEISPEIRKIEKTIVALVRQCQEGRISGPTIIEETPNGAVIETKAKPTAERPRPGASDKPDKDSASAKAAD